MDLVDGSVSLRTRESTQVALGQVKQQKGCEKNEKHLLGGLSLFSLKNAPFGSQLAC